MFYQYPPQCEKCPAHPHTHSSLTVECPPKSKFKHEMPYYILPISIVPPFLLRVSSVPFSFQSCDIQSFPPNILYPPKRKLSNKPCWTFVKTALLEPDGTGFSMFDFYIRSVRTPCPTVWGQWRLAMSAPPKPEQGIWGTPGQPLSWASGTSWARRLNTGKDVNPCLEVKSGLVR